MILTKKYLKECGYTINVGEIYSEVYLSNTIVIKFWHYGGISIQAKDIDSCICIMPVTDYTVAELQALCTGLRIELKPHPADLEFPGMESRGYYGC